MDIFLKDDFEGDVSREIWGMNAGPVKMIEDHSWKISNDFARNGKTSLKITCNHGDVVMPGVGKLTERAELVEKRELWLPHGVDVWYAFSFLIPEGFPVVDNRLLLAQFKQADNLYSPFLSLRFINGNFDVKMCGLDQQKKIKVKLENRNTWNDVLVNYCLSKDQRGKVKVWLNENEIANYNGELGFPDTPDAIHFNLGIYRDELEESQTIYFDRFRRGNSLKEIKL